MVSFFRVFSKVSIAIAASSVIGLASLVLVYELPVPTIRKNVAKSLEMLRPDKGSWAVGVPFSRISLHSDSDTLKMAAEPPDSSSFRDALLNPSSGTDGWGDQGYYDCLEKSLDDGWKSKHRATFFYGRYWNGSLLVVKPLLLLFSPAELRVFMASICLILFTLAVMAANWRFGAFQGLVLSVSIICMDPIGTSLCFHFQPDFIIALASFAILCRIGNEAGQKLKNRQWNCFLFSGILSAFFGRLAFPLITWGFPAIALALMIQKNDSSLPLRHSFFIWFVGYFGMWFSKIALATMLTGENILFDATQQALVRTAGNVGLPGKMGVLVLPLKACARNAWILFKSPVFTFVVIAILITVFLIVARRKEIIKLHAFTTCRPLLLVACSPLLWMCCFANHSYIHTWMASKSLSISVLAILSLPTAFRLHAERILNTKHLEISK